MRKPPKVDHRGKVIADRPNAIAKLVSERLTQQGWSSYDVNRQGGPPARTVSHWADPSVQWRNLPDPSTTEKIARGLRLPLARVQQAILETLGYQIADMSMPPDVQLVVAAMGELDEKRRRDVADMVLRLSEAFRDE